MSGVHNPLRDLKGGVGGAQDLVDDYCVFPFSVWKRDGAPGERVTA